MLFRLNRSRSSHFVDVACAFVRAELQAAEPVTCLGSAHSLGIKRALFCAWKFGSEYESPFPPAGVWTEEFVTCSTHLVYRTFLSTQGASQFFTRTMRLRVAVYEFFDSLLQFFEVFKGSY